MDLNAAVYFFFLSRSSLSSLPFMDGLRGFPDLDLLETLCLFGSVGGTSGSTIDRGSSSPALLLGIVTMTCPLPFYVCAKAKSVLPITL